MSDKQTVARSHLFRFSQAFYVSRRWKKFVAAACLVSMISGASPVSSVFFGFGTFGLGAAEAKDDDNFKLQATPTNTGAIVKGHGDRFKRIPAFGEFKGDHQKMPFPFPFFYVGDEAKLGMPSKVLGTTCSVGDRGECSGCLTNDEKGATCDVVQHPVPKWRHPPEFRHVYEVTNHYISWMPGADNVYGAYRVTVAVDRRDTLADVMGMDRNRIRWKFKDDKGKLLKNPIMAVGTAGKNLSALTWKDNDDVVKSDVVVVTDFPLVAGRERYAYQGNGIIKHYIDRYIYETPRWVVGYVADVSPSLGLSGLKRIEADRRLYAVEMQFKSAADMNPNYVRYGAFPPLKNLYRRDAVTRTTEIAPPNPIDNFWSGGYARGGDLLWEEKVRIAGWKGYALNRYVSYHYDNRKWIWLDPPRIERGATVDVTTHLSIDSLTDTGIMNLRWWEGFNTDGWGVPNDSLFRMRPGSAHTMEYSHADLGQMLRDGDFGEPTMDAIRRFDVNTCGRSLISPNEMRELHRKSAWRLAGKILAGSEIRNLQPVRLDVPVWGMVLPSMRSNLGRPMTWEPAGVHANTGERMVSVFPNREFAAPWLWAESARILSRAVNKGGRKLAPETLDGNGWNTDKAWSNLTGDDVSGAGQEDRTYSKKSGQVGLSGAGSRVSGKDRKSREQDKAGEYGKKDKKSKKANPEDRHEKMVNTMLSFPKPFWDIVGITPREYEHHPMWNDPVKLIRDRNPDGQDYPSDETEKDVWRNGRSEWENWKTTLPSFYRDMLPYVSRSLGMLFIPQESAPQSPDSGLRDTDVFWGSGKEYTFRPRAVLMPEGDTFFAKYDENRHWYYNRLTERDIMNFFTWRDSSFYRKHVVEIPKDVGTRWKNEFRHKNAKTDKLEIAPTMRAKITGWAKRIGRFMIYPSEMRESFLDGYEVSASGIAGVARIFPMDPMAGIRIVRDARALTDDPDMSAFEPLWREAPPGGRKMLASERSKDLDDEKRREQEIRTGHQYYYFLDGTSNMNIDAYAANPDCACVNLSAAQANLERLVTTDEQGEKRRKKFNNPRASGLYTPQLFDPPSRRFLPTALNGEIYFFGVDYGVVPELPDVHTYAWRLGDGRLRTDGTLMAPTSGIGSSTGKGLSNIKRVGTLKLGDEKEKKGEKIDIESVLPDDAWIGEDIRTLYKGLEIEAVRTGTNHGFASFDVRKRKPNLAELSFASWRDFRGLWKARNGYDWMVGESKDKRDVPPYARFARVSDALDDRYHVQARFLQGPERYPYPSVYDGLSDDGLSRVCGPDPMIRLGLSKGGDEYIVWEGEKGPFCHPVDAVRYDLKPESSDVKGRGAIVVLYVHEPYSDSSCGKTEKDREIYAVGDSFAMGVNSVPDTNVLYNRYLERGKPLPEGASPWKWSADNEIVAKVNAFGIVTCVGEGETTVRASFTQSNNIGSSRGIKCVAREKVQFISESDATTAFPSSHNGYVEIYDRSIRMVDLSIPPNATEIKAPFEPGKGREETRFDMHGFDVGTVNRLDYGTDILAWGEADWDGRDPVSSLADPALRAMSVRSVFGTKVPTGRDTKGNGSAQTAYARMRTMMERHLRSTFLRGYRVETLLSNIKPAYRMEILDRWERLLSEIPIYDAWVQNGKLVVVGVVSGITLDRALYPVYNREWNPRMFSGSYNEIMRYYANMDPAIAVGKMSGPGNFSVPAVSSFATGMAYQMLKLKEEGLLEGMDPEYERKLREIVKIGEGRAKNEYVPRELRIMASVLSGTTRTVRKTDRTKFADAAFHSVYADPVPPGQSADRKRYFLSGTGDFVMWVPSPLSQVDEKAQRGPIHSIPERNWRKPAEKVLSNPKIQERLQGKWYRVPVIQNDPTTGFLFEPWVLSDTMGFRSTSWMSSRPVSVFSRASSSMWSFGIDRWGRKWIRAGSNHPVIPLAED